jgi:hypothetical protein
MKNGYKRDENQGNCTWYAYGRAWEIAAQSRGEEPNSDNEPTYLRGRGNAGNWYRSLFNDESFSKERLGDTPQLGALVCWEDENSENGWGHLAVVEDITYNQNREWVSFQYSHSGYKSPKFGTGVYKSTDECYPRLGYKLAGFIYPERSYGKIISSNWYPVKSILQLNDKLRLNFISTTTVDQNTAVDILWTFPSSISGTNNNMTTTNL